MIFLKIDEETKGVYKCEAINSEGMAFKEYDVTVTIPIPVPDFHLTKLEINEGDSFTLTCPLLIPSISSKIQWIKVSENYFL